MRGASNSSVQPGWNLGGMGMFWGCARHASTDTFFLLAAGMVQVHVQPRAMLSHSESTPAQSPIGIAFCTRKMRSNCNTRPLLAQ